MSDVAPEGAATTDATSTSAPADGTAPVDPAPAPEQQADPAPADVAPAEVTPADPSAAPVDVPAGVPDVEVEAEQSSTDGTVELPAQTDPVSGATAYIVWDAVNNRFVAGPFLTSDEAQLYINFTEAKASRSQAYDGPTLSIGTVTFA